MEINEIKKLKVAKVKSMNSLLFFTRYFFKMQNNRKFIQNEHLEMIVEKLEAVVRGDIKNLIINIAPRYGKTELVIKMFIAWCLALNPRSKFIHLSYSDSLALDNSETIKDLVISEEFQQMFPGIEIKKDAKSKKKWYTNEGGGVYATSSAGQVTGFGAGSVDRELEEEINGLALNLAEYASQFGGAIVIDDPIKPEDADSKTLREKINNRFDSTIRNRVNSRNTPIIIVMQRLHEQDLSGYLIDSEPEEWDVLSLPCIKEDGTALWPFKHTLEELYKIKRVNEVGFERQYMQQPKPLSGILFRRDELKHYVGGDLRIDDVEAKNGYIDVADAGLDYHVLVVGFNIGPNVYIHDVIYTQENIDVNLPMCVEMIDRYQLDYCRCESNAAGAVYPRMLGQKVKTTSILPVANTTNKATRILMQSGFIKEYVHFRSDVEEGSPYALFMDSLTSYLKQGGAANDNDDAPDALAGLCQFIISFLTHLYDNPTEEF